MKYIIGQNTFNVMFYFYTLLDEVHLPRRGMYYGVPVGYTLWVPANTCPFEAVGLRSLRNYK